MTDMKPDLDHPCKQTCSGWRQGFEKAASNAQSTIDSLRAEVERLKAAGYGGAAARKDYTAWLAMKSRAEKAEKERDAARAQAKALVDLLREVPSAPKSPVRWLSLMSRIRAALKEHRGGCSELEAEV